MRQGRQLRNDAGPCPLGQCAQPARSLRVVQRLGFREEGLARDYLYIDGAWRDHLLFALVNPGFIGPESWPRAVG